ncbi:MAG: sigma-54-dependent Fis family transcriptional regulator [Planctomycetes bacterium]|nr:sigma-54-dependent Fis family transcriptional regulator [Planctomycetota bacterium]
MSPTIPRILLADDEALYLQTTAELLRSAGFDCCTASDAAEALQLLAEVPIDLAIVDLNMPGNLDLQLLIEGRRQYPDVPMLVVTGAPSLNSAIDSVRLQISDYLLKPLRFEELLAGIRRALAERLRPANRPLLELLQTPIAPPIVLGESAAIRHTLDVVGRIAPTDVSVLITGESGTGKELIAQVIHARSRRRAAPFVTIDCTAIPETLFESVLFGHVRGAFTSADRDQPGLLRTADGGTVFLDEIGELSLPSQAKLLRLIQHKTYTPVGQNRTQQLDVRFLAATNRSLLDLVQCGQFRGDLYYRLAVMPIEVPPLRQRGEDAALLAEHFLGELQRQSTLSPLAFSRESLQAMQRYDWPGNVRELRNVVERTAALAIGRVVELGDLPNRFRQPDSAMNSSAQRDHLLTQTDRDYLLNLLRSHMGNVSQSAAAAGLSRQGLYKLLRKHRIRPSLFRSDQ